MMLFKKMLRSHIGKWHVAQTAGFSVIVALLAVDQEYYKGAFYWVAAAMLAVGFFAVLTLTAMDYIQQDMEERKKVERRKRQLVSKKVA